MVGTSNREKSAMAQLRAPAIAMELQKGRTVSGSNVKSRLEKPNKTELDELVNMKYSEVEELRKGLRVIDESLNREYQSMEEISQQESVSRARCNQLGASFKIKQEEKKGTHEELHLADHVRDQRRASASALRQKLPFVTVELIGEELKKLEHRMQGGSQTTGEKHRLMQQIEGLRRSCSFVEDFNTRLIHITEDEGLHRKLLHNMTNIEISLAGIKTNLEDEASVLVSIRAREIAGRKEIAALHLEKDAIATNIWNLRQEVKKMRALFRAKEGEFYGKKERNHATTKCL